MNKVQYGEHTAFMIQNQTFFLQLEYLIHFDLLT